jgi:hypothetical protein
MVLLLVLTFEVQDGGSSELAERNFIRHKSMVQYTITEQSQHELVFLSCKTDL